MAITYPGFITLEGNTITIDSVNTTLNGGDHNTYDLTAQIPTAPNGTDFVLQPPAIQATLQVFVDGMLMKYGVSGEGDYVLATPSLVRFNFSIHEKSTVHASYSAALQAGV